MRIGSVCSGIEAASVAWKDYGVRVEWFSEVAPFQSRLLECKYPETPNVGDMQKIPELINGGGIPIVDMVCGGTPCQAFSLTGHQRGLEDERGRLTLKFLEIVDANDKALCGKGQSTIVFWENVEGVLKDKTNAFGCFVSELAGCTNIIDCDKWTNAGLIRGPKRNVAWRVLDAKYFGVPQQRRRLYVIAGGKDFNPEVVLFETHKPKASLECNDPNLIFCKGGKRFEVFRAYTDCLYSAYGTKWNGNAAAYNGSLFVAEEGRLRRMTPLEVERLMGFPDGYTNLEFAKRTSRYQGVGNSWAVPVVRWIGERLFIPERRSDFRIDNDSFYLSICAAKNNEAEIYFFSEDIQQISVCESINVSARPEVVVQSRLADIIDSNAEEDLFISPVGCKGILRRCEERGMNMNPRLKAIMERIASKMNDEDIERISRRQRRGEFSLALERSRKAVSSN